MYLEDTKGMRGMFKRLRLSRNWLLVAVVLSLLALAPMGLVTGNDPYFQTITAPAVTLLQSNLLSNLARPNWDYPGEFMLAANLTSVANYFCFVLKQINPSGTKTQNYKVIGSASRLYLVSLVIRLFYLFYLKTGTNADADPQAGKVYNMRRVAAL
jgi:hypothetical protein